MRSQWEIVASRVLCTTLLAACTEQWINFSTKRQFATGNTNGRRPERGKINNKTFNRLINNLSFSIKFSTEENFLWEIQRGQFTSENTIDCQLGQRGEIKERGKWFFDGCVNKLLIKNMKDLWLLLMTFDTVLTSNTLHGVPQNF